MSEIKVDRSVLVELLKQTQRIAVVNGKQFPQVESTVLDSSNYHLYTTAIVRDGITSIARFRSQGKTENERSDLVPVSNIGQLLGALKAHSGAVVLSHDNDRLRIRSGSKQTTLVSSGQAKAFAHSQKTVNEWAEDSRKRFDSALSQVQFQVMGEARYIMQDGTQIAPSAECTIEASELHDALIAGGINGQKVERVLLHFIPEECSLKVTVGDDLKGGKTATGIDTITSTGDRHFAASVGGGLAFCLPTKGTLRLRFFDFSAYDAGTAISFDCAGSCVFVREVK